MKGLYIASQKPLELDGIPIIDKGQIGAFVPEMITVTFVLDGVTYTYDVPKTDVAEGKNYYSLPDSLISISWSIELSLWSLTYNSQSGSCGYTNPTDSEFPIFDTWTFDGGDFELDSLVTSAFEIKRGYEWTFNASGNVYGFDVNAGDVIRALIDNPTDVTGWNVECNQFNASGDFVPTSRTINGYDLSADRTLIATDVDALKRDGSNANSDVDLGSNSLNAKSVKVNGTGGNGHVGLKHQASNATAGGSETALFAGSDGELYYKNDSSTLAQIASRAWVTAQGFITNVITALGYTPVPTTRTINGQDLSVNRVLSFFPLFCVKNVANATTGGTARYTSFQDSTNVGTTQSTNTNVIPIDTTFYNFYIETSNAQPATGSCVLTIQKNGVDTDIVVTIPAGSAAGKFYDNTHEAAFLEGHSLGIKWVNNASTSSCTVVSMSIASK